MMIYQINEACDTCLAGDDGSVPLGDNQLEPLFQEKTLSHHDVSCLLLKVAYEGLNTTVGETKFLYKVLVT